MKKYRVYFNRTYEWPQCWSIDEGDQTTEINVVGFELRGAHATSHTLPKDARVDHHDTPFAWLEVFGHLELICGVAILTA